MTLWIVQKVRMPVGDEATEDCLGSNVVAEVTVKDLDTGEYRVFQTCYDPTVAPCATGGLLDLLHSMGLTPADWDTECGF